MGKKETVSLSPDQIIRALSDYCGAYDLVSVRGPCRVTLETKIVNGRLESIVLEYEENGPSPPVLP